MPPIRTLAAASALIAMAMALPLLASAASVVYTDANNVWVASPDGSAKRQVTTNGTPDVKWVAASQADTGKILAFLKAGSNSTMTYMNPDGATIASGLTPVQSCDLGISGPMHSRLSPDGSLAVYDYFCQRGVYYGYSTDPFTVVTGTARVSDIGSVTLNGWNPSFIPGTTGPGQASDKLLVSSFLGTGIFEYTMTAPPTDRPVLEGAAGGGIWSADVSRDGTRLVGDVTSASGVEELFAYTLSVLRDPGAGFSAGCRIPTGPRPSQPNWSPDGGMVAWSDAEGVKVATVLSLAGSVASPPACGMGAVTVLSASGINPVFSNAAAPTPAGAGGGAPTASGLAVTIPRSISRSALRTRGLRISTPCPAACTVRATLRASSGVLARGRAILRRKGTARIVLKARVPAKTRSVTVTVTRAGLTGTRTVKVTG
jgi:hypothetical protein